MKGLFGEGGQEKDGKVPESQSRKRGRRRRSVSQHRAKQAQVKEGKHREDREKDTVTEGKQGAEVNAENVTREVMATYTHSALPLNKHAVSVSLMFVIKP